MTSSNGSIFGVTGPLCGEFIGHQWISLTKASDVELWCFLCLNERLSKQLRRRWFDNVTMYNKLLSIAFDDLLQLMTYSRMVRNRQSTDPVFHCWRDWLLGWVAGNKRISQLQENHRRYGAHTSSLAPRQVVILITHVSHKKLTLW